MTDTSTAVAVYTEPAGSELEQWARDLAQAYQMAVRLVTTSFVPATYNGKPEEAAAAIVTGAELGLTPLASLRSIDIIHGVPGMRAIALRALVQSRGHEMWIEESTATRCVMKGKRKGSDKVETSTWTIERAQGLQLHNKDNWKKQPIAMLVARATSELARLIAADVLLGIPYSIEELEDLGDTAAVPAGDAAPRRPSTRAARKPLAEKAIALEPPLPADEAPDEPAIEEGTRSAEELAAVDLEDEARLEEARRRAEEEFAKDAPADGQPMLVEPPVEWDPPVVEEPKP
jgi:hypothetical protein